MKISYPRPPSPPRLVWCLSPPQGIASVFSGARISLGTRVGAGDPGVRLDSRGKHFPRKSSMLASTRAVFKPVVDRIDSLELQVGEGGMGVSRRRCSV